MTRTVRIATRSNAHPVGCLTLDGKPMPYLHRNARSRYITRQEILDVYLEETRRR
jgi:hypothetical protein